MHEYDCRARLDEKPVEISHFIRVISNDLGEIHYESLGGVHWFQIKDSGLRYEVEGLSHSLFWHDELFSSEWV